MIPNYAVIATHNKQRQVTDLVWHLSDLGIERVVIIDNASQPQLESSALPAVSFVHYDPEQPPNLSRLWNIGLDWVSNYHEDTFGDVPWNVCILNDDVRMTETWISSVSEHLRGHPTAALAYGDQHGFLSGPTLHSTLTSTDALLKICGYAHMSRGELGIRFDESMRWWYSDDDYDWQARKLGGSLVVPHVRVHHDSPDVATMTTPALYEQACRDRETFIAKWGIAPC